MAALLRLLLVVPGVFLPTLGAVLQALSTTRAPATVQVLFGAWLAQAVWYLLANALILASRCRRPRLERVLTYTCMAAEVGTNHLIMMSIGTLASHNVVFIVVAIAIYRVFLDYRLSLAATLLGLALYLGTGLGELAGRLPVAAALAYAVHHPAYAGRAAAVSTLVAVPAAVLIAFAAINYGVNQSLKLHRYITESVLRRYLPASLVARAARGELRLDAPPERRVVTVLFADLVDFTALSEQLGAEAISELVNRFLSRMAEIAHRHGATVDKFVGDAVMVVFGAPEALEPAAQARRCVALALEMQAATPTVDARYPLRCRTGINTGDAVVGNFGSLVRSDYTVLGPAVNLAARLEAAAEPGRVLIGPETACLLDGDTRLEPAGELLLKGVAGRVKAYYVAALADQGEPVPPGPS